MKAKIQIITEEGVVYVGEVKLTETRSDKTESIPVRAQSSKKKVTCKSVLEGFWEKGGFKTPLSLKELKLAIKERDGCHFPDNTLLMALASAKFLTRRGIRGNYSWVQKYPA